MRFARNVQFQLKHGKAAEFNRILTNDVLPVLRKQNGFEDELALVDGDGDKAMAISLWADRPSAESYRTNTYPTILQKLAPVIEGTPRVETYDVGATTLNPTAVSA